MPRSALAPGPAARSRARREGGRKGRGREGREEGGKEGKREGRRGRAAPRPPRPQRGRASGPRAAAGSASSAASPRPPPPCWMVRVGVKRSPRPPGTGTPGHRARPAPAGQRGSRGLRDGEVGTGGRPPQRRLSPRRGAGWAREGPPGVPAGRARGRGRLCCRRWAAGRAAAGTGRAPAAPGLGLVPDGPPGAAGDGGACGLGGLPAAALGRGGSAPPGPTPAPALFTSIVAGRGYFVVFLVISLFGRCVLMLLMIFKGLFYIVGLD